MIKIFVASDHAGIDLKAKVLNFLSQSRYTSHYEVHDLGPQTQDRVDYPDYADLVCRKIHGLSLISTDSSTPSFLNEYGILICGSGQGMSMRANKYQHIRAALCWNAEVTELARAHNNANVLCLGARVMDSDLCLQLVEIFFKTSFENGRHLNRVAKISTSTDN